MVMIAMRAAEAVTSKAPLNKLRRLISSPPG